VVEHEVVDDAVAVLIHFRAIEALLLLTAGEAWREIEQTIGSANLKRRSLKI
jgi:hypothetical protein